MMQVAVDDQFRMQYSDRCHECCCQRHATQEELLDSAGLQVMSLETMGKRWSAIHPTIHDFTQLVPTAV